MSEKLSIERLKKLLSYSPETGDFTWLTKRGRAVVGGTAGHLDSRGYVRIIIDGKKYRAHRLAWFYMHGKWPEDQIDHVNGKYSDNRLKNLREATCSQNNFNKPLQKNNTSGVKGVYWHKGKQRWRAICRVDGKRYAVGEFLEIEKAAEAIKDFREANHGSFARNS